MYHADIGIATEDALWKTPEVLRGNSVSNKSDLYSFGIIMQEVLLCSKPYAANEPQLETSDITKLVSAHGTSFRPSIPGFQAEWIGRKLLAREPRFKTRFCKHTM